MSNICFNRIVRCSVRTTLFTTLASVLLVFVTAACSEERSVTNSSSEYGFLTGYGVTHKYFGATRTQVQTWDAIARYGWFLTDEIGKGNWYQGRHQLLVELPYHMAVDHDARSMVGGYLLGSWKFTGLDRFAPYVFAGGGILFVDLGLPTMGTRLDYSYQAGSGVQYFIRPDLALTAEYRYHHISNAGTANPNEPLNSSKFLFGLSIYR
jgi:lipid A 3-O-deacylase